LEVGSAIEEELVVFGDNVKLVAVIECRLVDLI